MDNEHGTSCYDLDSSCFSCNLGWRFFIYWCSIDTNSKKMSMSLEERIQMMIKVGRQFNKIAVPSLIILIATGLYNSSFVLSNPDLLFSTSYGSFLFIKIILVIVIIIAFVAHIRIIRKEIEDKIMSKEMTEIQIQKLRKKMIILGEIIVIISVAILFFAALLDAGV